MNKLDGLKWKYESIPDFMPKSVVQAEILEDLEFLRPHIKSELDELKIELAEATLESYKGDVKNKLYDSKMIYTDDEIRLLQKIKELE